MSTLVFVNQESILKWLTALGIQHYMCGQCQGIHISELQSHENVLESRIFLEQECLIFSTEIDILNAELLAINAELPKLNGTYANLKAFLDISNEGPARLIICDTQWISAGLSKDQFGVFAHSAIEAKLEILRLLATSGFIGTAFEAEDAQHSSALH